MRPVWQEIPSRFLPQLLDPARFWTDHGTYEDEEIVFDEWQIAHLRDFSRIRFREKAPQIGFSWLCAAEAVWEAILFEDSMTGFISVDQREAQNKILYARKLYDGLPPVIHQLVPLVGGGKEQLEFGSLARPSQLLSLPATAGMRGRRMNVVLDEALALDTPLPTPTGWTTMGDVRVGDKVIGRDGLPTEITKLTDIQDDRLCWRVTFADGTSVTASDGHRWESRISGGRSSSLIRTTGEMARAKSKFRVPRAAPLKNPDIPLPIDPYILGLWLGDGNSSQAQVSCGDRDREAIRREIEKRGYTANTINGGLYVSRPGSHRNRFSPVKGLKVLLRENGLLGNKHIPSLYLRAGTEQRLELLRGLMDSDGHADRHGYCTFVQARQSLTEDVMELLRSLGQLVHLKWRPDRRSHRYGGCFKLHFRPVGIQPFSLHRKAMRIKSGGDSWTTISSIEPTPTVPVRCVSVDAIDHLFLAGSGWTVTGNSDFYIDGGFATFRAGMGRIARGGRLTLGSTVFGTDTVLDTMMKGVDDDGKEIDEAKTISTARFPIAVAENPTVIETAELARAVLDSNDYAEEYECVRGGALTDPFPAQLLRQATHEQSLAEVRLDGEILRIYPDPDTQVCIGYDVGKGSGRHPSIANVFELRGQQWVQVGVIQPQKANGAPLSLPEQQGWLTEMLARLPNSRLVPDGQGIGAHIAQALEKKFGSKRVIVMIAGSKPKGMKPQDKTEMIVEIKRAMEAGETVLMIDKEQMKQFRRTKKAPGGIYVQSGSTKRSHFDRFWSACYAQYGIGLSKQFDSAYRRHGLRMVGGEGRFEEGGTDVA